MPWRGFVFAAFDPTLTFWHFSSLTGGCSEGLGAFWFFFKQQSEANSSKAISNAKRAQPQRQLSQSDCRWVRPFNGYIYRLLLCLCDTALFFPWVFSTRVLLPPPLPHILVHLVQQKLPVGPRGRGHGTPVVRHAVVHGHLGRRNVPGFHASRINNRSTIRTSPWVKNACAR